MRQTFRQAADGMDSETLLKQCTAPNISNISTRHTNLSLSSKSATIVKSQLRQYIPHEPVRGAVKHIDSKTKHNHGLIKKPVQHVGSRHIYNGQIQERENITNMEWNMTPIGSKAGSHSIDISQSVDIVKYRTSTPVKSSKSSYSSIVKSEISPRLSVSEMVSDSRGQVEGNVSKHFNQSETTLRLSEMEKQMKNQIKVLYNKLFKHVNNIYILIIEEIVHPPIKYVRL